MRQRHLQIIIILHREINNTRGLLVEHDHSYTLPLSESSVEYEHSANSSEKYRVGTPRVHSLFYSIDYQVLLVLAVISGGAQINIEYSKVHSLS